MRIISRPLRRRKKLLDELKDRRGYAHSKEEALDRTMWRNSFGRGVGPVVRQNTEWMNEVFQNINNKFNPRLAPLNFPHGQQKLLHKWVQRICDEKE
jgi:hypothetical protein